MEGGAVKDTLRAHARLDDDVLAIRIMACTCMVVATEALFGLFGHLLKSWERCSRAGWQRQRSCRHCTIVIGEVRSSDEVDEGFTVQKYQTLKV